MLSQTLQALHDICGSGDLIAEMPAKLVDFGSRGGKAHAFVVALLIAATAGRGHPTPSRRAAASQASACAATAEATLRGSTSIATTLAQMIPSVISCTRETTMSKVACRHRDDRKPEQRHGVAGQHEDVAARCAVDQREIETDADPQRDAEAEQFGRIRRGSGPGRSSLPRRSAFPGCDRRPSSEVAPVSRLEVM